ncbi:MAG: LamG-like jellyroll fold domain-containing protein [Gammaproteobacteria bacterium]
MGLEMGRGAKPRQFTTAYKLWILEELDTSPEEETAILQREGLLPAHVKYWRRQKEKGELGGLVARRGHASIARDPASLSDGQALPERSFTFKPPWLRYPDSDIRIHDGMQLEELFATIWRGKWMVLCTVCVLLLLTVVVLFNVTPVYSGQALIMLEGAQNIEGVEGETGLESDAQMLETEMQVMQSRGLAKRVVDQHKLDAVEEFNPTIHATTGPISRLANFVNSLFGPGHSAPKEAPTEADRLAGTGTWAFWMKTDAVWGINNSDPNNRAVIMSRYDSDPRNGLFILQWPGARDGHGGWVNVSAYNSSTGVCGLRGPAAHDNLWHHIAVTYSRASSGQITLYKDGVKSGSCTNSATWNFNNQSVRLGASRAIFWEEWKGALNDVRIYNRALLAEEITNLYNARRSHSSSANATSITGDLVGHWKLDQSRGTAAPDSSDVRNAGRLVNGPTWISGKIGNALSFDGVNDYVDVASSEKYDSTNHTLIIDELLQHIRVSQMGQSRVISVEVESRDPLLAANIANGLGEAYVADQLEAKFRQIRRNNEWLKEHIAVLRGKVTQAETEIESFRNSSGLLDLLRGQPGEFHGQAASQLNSELSNAHARRSEAEARLREARNHTETLDSPLMHSLKERVTELDREIAEQSMEYGPAHPRMANLQAQKTDLSDKVALEIRRNLGGLENEVRVARSREAGLVAQSKTLTGRLANANQADVKIRALEREAAAARSLLESFLQRFHVTTSYLDTQTPNARIISRADPPSAPSFPKPIPILGLSLFGSTFLGVMLTLINNLFRRGFSSSESTESATRLPVLGSVPKLGLLARLRTGPDSYTLRRPNSAFSEAIRALNRRIRLTGNGQLPRRLLVTSSLPREGKTVIASALAHSLSMAGHKTALVKIEKAKKVHNNPDGIGLGEYLAGKAKLGEVIHKDQLSGVDVIPPGKLEPSFLPELLDSDLMDNLLAELGDSYDFVIVDSPPIMAVSDALILGSKVDMILFIVRWASTHQDVVCRVLDRLSSCKAPVGLALSMVGDVAADGSR